MFFLSTAALSSKGKKEPEPEKDQHKYELPVRPHHVRAAGFKLHIHNKDVYQSVVFHTGRELMFTACRSKKKNTTPTIWDPPTLKEKLCLQSFCFSLSSFLNLLLVTLSSELRDFKTRNINCSRGSRGLRGDGTQILYTYRTFSLCSYGASFFIMCPSVVVLCL